MPGGGLPVAGGDQIVPVVNHLLRGFHPDRRIATKDRHPRGHISLASSYVGFAPMTVLDHCNTMRIDGKAINVEVDVLHPDGRESHYVLVPESFSPQAKLTLADFADYLGKVGRQVLWPDHGIAGTKEAELHPGIVTPDAEFSRPEQAFGYVLVKGLNPARDSNGAFFDNLHRPTELADVLRERGVKRGFVCGLAFDVCAGLTGIQGVECEFEIYMIRDATRSVNIPPGPATPGSVDWMLAEFERVGVKVIDSTDLAITA